MASVKLFNPPTLSPAHGFAHAAAAGGWVWLGGQISVDADGTILFKGDIVRQFGQALRNVRSALEAAGSEPQSVVKLTYYVIDVAAYRAALKPIGEAYRSVFAKHYPAASLFEVRALFEPEALIEIECVAVGRSSADA